MPMSQSHTAQSLSVVYDLMTCRINDDFLARWQQDQQEFKGGSPRLQISVGLDGFNGKGLKKELQKASPSPAAVQFSASVRNLEVPSFGLFADRMIHTVVQALGHQDVFRRTYSDWAFTKVGKVRERLVSAQAKIRAALEAPSVSLSPEAGEASRRFMENAAARLDTLETIHDLVVHQHDEAKAQRLFQESQSALGFFDDADMNIKGDEPAMVISLCGGPSAGASEFARFVVKSRCFLSHQAAPDESPLHDLRMLTKLTFTYPGSTLDVAAFLWLMGCELTQESLTQDLGSISGDAFRAVVDEVLKDLETHGFDSWAQRCLHKLPARFFDDAEPDDLLLAALLQRMLQVGARHGCHRTVQRATLFHPQVYQVLKAEGLEPLEGPTGTAVILSNGVSEENQRLALPLLANLANLASLKVDTVHTRV